MEVDCWVTTDTGDDTSSEDDTSSSLSLSVTTIGTEIGVRVTCLKSWTTGTKIGLSVARLKAM